MSGFEGVDNVVYGKAEHLQDVTERARAIMERENVEAIVASSCENFYYLSGHPSTFMYTLRMNEVALAVIFRDPSRRTVIIMNEFEAAGVPDNLPNASCERTRPGLTSTIRSDCAAIGTKDGGPSTIKSRKCSDCSGRCWRNTGFAAARWLSS